MKVIIICETPPVYLIISKFGIVGTYDARLQLQKSYKINMNEPNVAQWVQKPQTQPFITGKYDHKLNHS